jgi:hypothetical protein
VLAPFRKLRTELRNRLGCIWYSYISTTPSLSLSLFFVNDSFPISAYSYQRLFTTSHLQVSPKTFDLSTKYE